MFNRESQQPVGAPADGRRIGLIVVATVVAAALIGSLTAMALASSSTAPAIGSAANAKFGEHIVVDARGRTLYALSPETTHHVLCKSSECLRLWPPLTVASSNVKLKAGAGVHGHLGILRRAHNVFQVTLAGLPLYRFSRDGGKGRTEGENLKSFGGTWHVVSATTDAPLKPAVPGTMPSSPSPSAPPTPSEKYSY